VFYIQVSDGQFINQPFHSINECRSYCIRHNIHGYQFLDEYQLQQMREDAQPDTRHRSFDKSIIRRAYQPRESNMRVPVQPYYQQCAPNRPVPYRKVSNSTFKPHFAGKKKVIQ